MKKINTYATSSFEMEWYSFGTGAKSLVIIPGLSLKSVMCNVSAVENVYGKYGDKYTIYIIDKVKNPPADYSVKDMAADTVGLIRHLGLEDIYLFGASLGGMISQQIAVDYPDLVKKLVVASSLSRTNDMVIEINRSWIEKAQKHNVVALNRDFVKMIYSKQYYNKYAAVFKMFENQGTAEECDKFCIFAKACMSFNIYDSLDKIKCPVLVTGAKGDMVLGCKASEEIAEKLGCECYIYPEEYGHAVYDEAEDYPQRLIDFFDKEIR